MTNKKIKEEIIDEFEKNVNNIFKKHGLKMISGDKPDPAITGIMFCFKKLLDQAILEERKEIKRGITMSCFIDCVKLNKLLELLK